MVKTIGAQDKLIFDEVFFLVVVINKKMHCLFLLTYFPYLTEGFSSLRAVASTACIFRSIPAKRLKWADWLVFLHHYRFFPVPRLVSKEIGSFKTWSWYFGVHNPEEWVHPDMTRERNM